MESLTYIKNVHISPKKLRFIISDVKKHTPVDSVQHLFYMENKAAKILYKALKSAIASAQSTLKVREDMLQFKLLTVEEGQKLKRYRAGSRGMARPYVRRHSHIKIILEV